ncbi:hypothetical protein EJB05_36104 [Eragrostis curvula]|uniref:Uncharacterized protein n=1 Tax=Eragrostis curvula TaxID=38414 RepID=A0A5J9U883_9POAL|nr:hypothetical protein EJB05_36104 [Eragrostis curvula]
MNVMMKEGGRPINWDGWLRDKAMSVSQMMRIQLVSFRLKRRHHPQQNADKEAWSLLETFKRKRRRNGFHMLCR